MKSTMKSTLSSTQKQKHLFRKSSHSSSIIPTHRRLTTRARTPSASSTSRLRRPLQSLHFSSYDHNSCSSSEDLAPVPQHILHQQGKLSSESVSQRLRLTEAAPSSSHTNLSQAHHPTTNLSLMDLHPDSLSKPPTFNAMFPPTLLQESNNNINNPFCHYSQPNSSSTNSSTQSLSIANHLPPRNIFHNVTSVPVPESLLVTPDQFESQTDDHHNTYLHGDSSPAFNKPVRSVLLIKKWNSKQAALYSNHIAEYLTKQNVQVFVEPSSINDYEADYPSIFELMHQVDIDFHKLLPDAFPSFVDTSLASTHGSLVHTAQKDALANNNEITHPEQQPHQSASTQSSAQSTSHSPSPPPLYHNTETPRYSQSVNETLQQIKSRDFWKDYQRTDSMKSNFRPLAQRECIPFIRKYQKWQEFIDIVVAVGGDGTLLHVSTLFSHQVPPVLGFSCGSFGFLMPFNPDRAEQAIDKVIKGGMRYQRRNRLFFKVQQNQTLGEKQQFPINQFDPDCFHLLNEVTLKHSYNLNSSASVSDLECRVNGHLLARYQGDGVILATPTGSTAYSLAAGGSIIHPSMNCLLITPIAPMTLSSRPVIIPSDSILTLSPVSSPVLLEGKYGRVVHPGESIIISTSKFPIPVFCRRDATSDFMQDLGSRLNYSRMFRFKRESDDITDLPQGQAGVFLSKRHEM